MYHNVSIGCVPCPSNHYTSNIGAASIEECRGFKLFSSFHYFSNEVCKVFTEKNNQLSFSLSSFLNESFYKYSTIHYSHTLLQLTTHKYSFVKYL